MTVEVSAQVIEEEAAKNQNGHVPEETAPAEVVPAPQPGATAGKKGMDIGPCATGDEAIEKLRKLGRKKVAIVGFSPSSYHMAPFQDPEWEVWTLNEAYTLPALSRADRWFEIHVRDEIDVTLRDANHIKWLRTQRGLPIYMIRKFDDIPMAVEYPIKEFMQAFRTDYWTNSISYMIALAVAEGFETIGIWGVDMAQPALLGGPSEYGEQRPSCEYFIGWARARGITVYVPPQSDLLKSIGLYGYDGDGSRFKGKIRARVQELQGRIGQHRQQIEILGRNRWAAAGAIQEFNNTLPPDQMPEDVKARIQKRVDELNVQIQTWDQETANQQRMTHQLEGAVDDCFYWLRNWAPMVRVESDVEPLALPPEQDVSHLRTNP